MTTDGWTIEQGGIWRILDSDGETLCEAMSPAFVEWLIEIGKLPSDAMAAANEKADIRRPKSE